MIAWVSVALGAEIVGVVTGPGGPIAGATVVAYDLRLRAVAAVTDADGRYEVPVDPGTWRVRVLPPADVNAVEAYAPGVDDLCAAQAFDVGQTATVDVLLAEGGVLVGVLTGEGVPQSGAEVSVAPVAETLALEGRTAITDAQGAFRVVGLHPAGTFTVEVSSGALPTQYLPGVYDDLVAAVYAPGGATDDAGTTDLLSGIRVSGQVVADGAPLPAGTAQVYVPSQLRSELVFDGDYAAVGLPPGDLLVWAIAAGYATTYFPDADRPDERIPVPDEGGAAVADIDMPLESRLHGRLPGSGPFAGGAVVAYNTDRTVGVGAVVEDDGTFSIGGLHGGLYTLAVYADEAGVVTGTVVNGLGDVTFDVPPEQTLDVGVVPAAIGGRFAGTVVDRYTGEGLYGAYVHAESRASGAVFTATTAGDGTYLLAGIAPGEYELWADYTPACTADPDWLSRWYPDNPTDAFALAQSVLAAEEFLWDAAIAPDFDHDGMDDVWEVENGLDPERDDSAEDPDGDGFTNLEEYFLGTDPRAAADSGGGCGCATAPVGGWVPPLVASLAAWRRRRPRRTGTDPAAAAARGD